MASITKRGKTWQYSISRYIDGKPKHLRKGGFPTRKACTEAANLVADELRRGLTIKHTNIPLAAYFGEWLEIYHSHQHRTTYERYQNTHMNLVKYFGDKPLQSISKREYQRFLNEYSKGKSRATVRKLNTHVRDCIQEAIDEGYIRVDFTRKADLKIGRPAKRSEEKHISFQDSERLLMYFFSNELVMRMTHYVLLLALTSGMRFGEIVGLTRSDFDFERNTITVNKTWDYKRGTGFMPTKNPQSNRVIDMDAVTMMLFKELFATLSTGYKNLVFYSAASVNRVLTNEAVNKELRIILAKLNIDPPITIHGLRHTHASVLLYRRISIYYISERLGHNDIQTTNDTYAHVIKELREEDSQLTAGTFTDMLNHAMRGVTNA